MLQPGNHVLYGVHGICTIVGIESMKFGKQKADYYCLHPLEHPDSRFYIPVGNETAVSALKPLMSKEQLTQLLKTARSDCWIADEAARKQRYKELLIGSDREALLNMIHCLYRHKEQQRLSGKKAHQCDDAFLHDAQRLLNAEFALVFGLKREEVEGFIRKGLGLE